MAVGWSSVGATTTVENWVIGAIRDATIEVTAVVSSDAARCERYAQATECMTQQPRGEVTMCCAAGEERLPIDREGLHLRSVRVFGAAKRHEREPSARSEDGIRSLAISRRP